MSTFEWARDLRLAFPNAPQHFKSLNNPRYNTFEVLGAIEVTNPKSRKDGEIIRIVGQALAIKALMNPLPGILSMPSQNFVNDILQNSDILDVFVFMEKDNGELRVDKLGMHDTFRDRFRSAQIGETFKYRRTYEKVDPAPYLHLVENQKVMGDG